MCISFGFQTTLHCLFSRPVENVLTVLSENKTKVPVDDKKETKEPDKTHRDGVRMNATSLRREQHIKRKLQKK